MCLAGQFAWCACEQFEELPSGIFMPSDETAVLEPIPNHLNRPNFSLATILFVGFWATLAFVTGWCFGMGVGR
jgi:hypothetical protein